MKVLLSVFILVFSGLVVANPVSRVVIFGDSLSDTGNLFKSMEGRVPSSPPYHEGRFTNGEVWVEYLMTYYYPLKRAEHLQVFAVGGAAVSEEDNSGVLFTLKSQIEAYLKVHEGKAEADSLLIIFIGANNYLGVPDDAERALVETNTGIKHGVQRLVAAGANHIVLVTLPNLGDSPMAHAYGIEEQMTYFSDQHNMRLYKSVEDLRRTYPGVQVLYFDVRTPFDALMADPKKYGFSNTKGTCYDVLANPSQQSGSRMATRVKKKKNGLNKSCEGYVFFDPVHPTSLVHKIMADRAREFLDAAGIEFTN